ncbi:aromatic ring-hydroxylating oxygenase subunit alpha [Burkholderia gladioli]|uniref:aromatic ring-hydroxylating oxygenase subunit alpha n=1 Tax=Burkholderia gladioli TaxID=28095 RepID=UPI000BBD03B5|nr:Rieske 2Fe-2S domain-containing protein [Burkholderia gladioli]ATF85855.1 Rieske (2Fe-2S) protein [Burkholderia gladioli pv. gladioli]MBJ9715708.1 Rieske 2Fe-2S domain-containing protein [Burkholderia gladioli]MBU9158599.1 Rieske 2Fe-2S domain-containing protein [Burkholderia gladioli]MCH7274923.1 Rieske 2Fe-2S domain-containing protein [Burkholderia gladioli]MDR8088645.1 Rieske 2Fe-2S domain-containing protein [Burkholderia gladioli]
MDFDRELVARHWQLLGHRRELPADGDFVRFDSAAGEIVVFNDGGELVAFDNRCPHRGARLYVEDSGNQAASCAYHGWTYRQGQLIIPGRERFRHCRIEQAALNRYALDWCGDFLFVGMRPATDLSTQLGEFEQLVADISFNIDRRVDLNRYDYGCYWPLAVENALEPYHIGAVHPGTLGTLALDDGENRFHGANSAWFAPLGAARQRNQLAKLRRLFAIDFQYEGYLSLYLFPFTMISSTYGYSYSLQHFLPAGGGADLARFTSRLYAAPTVGAQADAIVEPFLASTTRLNRQVFEEDHAICRRLPRDAWSMAPLEFAADTEVKIDHFRAACRAFDATLRRTAPIASVSAVSAAPAGPVVPVVSAG